MQVATPSSSSISEGEWSDLSSTSGGPLADLLDDEYYLQKILACLIDYGLHECRRVCKKWYEVSKKLPLKLERVQVGHVPRIAEAFPNAASVSVGLSYCDVVGRGSEDQQLAGICADVLNHLASLNNLKAFSVICYGCCYGGAELLGPSLMHFDNLNSLRLDFYSMKAACDLYSQIRYLTNLTSLESNFSGSGELAVDPFTELKKIQRLEVPHHLFNNDGRFMFPALTNLMHLGFEGNDAQLLRLLEVAP